MTIFSRQNIFNYALAAFFFALPLYVVRFSIGPLPTTLLELSILFLTVAWLAQGGASETRELVKELWKSHRGRALLFLSALFFLSALIGVFVSPDIFAAVGLLRAYWIEPMLVALIVMTRVKTSTQLARLFGALTLSACSIAAVAIIQKFTGWHIPAPWDVERRATSIYPYPNAVGLYLAPIVPLAIFFFRKNWFACGGSVLMLVFGIVFAQTEGVLVALVVGAMGVGLAWNRRTRIIVVAAILAGALIVAALPPHVQDTVSRTLTLRDWSGKVRKSIWSESIAMLRERPVFGAGLAGYQKAIEPYHKAKYLEIFLYPHNVVLNFWTETGILGVFSFFALVAWFLYAVSRSPAPRSLRWALCSSMAIILIHGIVDVPYFKNDLAVFFWFLIAGAVILSRPLETKRGV